MNCFLLPGLAPLLDIELIRLASFLIALLVGRSELRKLEHLRQTDNAIVQQSAIM